MKNWLFLACLAFTAPLAAETKILAVAGSTRSDSYNKKLVQEAARIARQAGATVTIVDLKDYPMPLYDADLESQQGMPINAKRLRDKMIESQAIIIASPEYNSSVSAVLKNALDWASRNEQGEGSRDAFKGKKFAIMSASPGGGGGARGLVHLRAIIENVGGEVIQPQLTVPDAFKAFNLEGHLEDSSLNQQLNQEIQQLLDSKVSAY